MVIWRWKGILFNFVWWNEVDVNEKSRILLITLLLLLWVLIPGHRKNSFVLIDKLVPNNIRLTNDISSGTEFAGVEKTVNSFLRKWSIAGASIAIAKDGKLIYAHGFGYADTASKTEAQPYSQIQNASISKLVTSVWHYEASGRRKAVTNFEILAILNWLYGWASVFDAVSAYPNPWA